MAKVKILETITYGRVSYMCSLRASDAHLLGSTLWARTPSIMVATGLLVGAQQYHCAKAPCIVDDTGTDHKIWYAGVNDDLGVPVMWCVEHACKVNRQAKQTEYYEWPVTPRVMLVIDAVALRSHLRDWTPNSMAAACMQAKALDFLDGKLGVTLSQYGWEALVDLSKDTLLKATDKEQE